MIPLALRRLVHPLASLRITVVLLAMSMVLVFAGTLAQVEMGIWQVMEIYFRSPIVMLRFDLFLPRGSQMPGALPFPGGAVLGAAILVNLLAAHLIRFKLSWKRSGIFLIHFSLILLIVGEGITAFTALETQMPIYEGQTIQWSQDIREVELAVIAPGGQGALDQVVAIPQALLVAAARKRQPISDPNLPFDLEIIDYMSNARVFRNPPTQPMPPIATHGMGLELRALQVPDASGVGDEQVSVPSAYVAVIDRTTGQRLGIYLVSPNIQSEPFIPLPQEVAGLDPAHTLTLRFRRYYKDYQMRLDQFNHDLYPGTTIPKNFSSDIHLTDPAHGEDRNVLIYMNNPLRYRGETFFQSGYIPGDRGTILQVVDNPAWQIPYIACVLGGFGLLIHFLISLFQFLRRRARA